MSQLTLRAVTCPEGDISSGFLVGQFCCTYQKLWPLPGGFTDGLRQAYVCQAAIKLQRKRVFPNRKAVCFGQKEREGGVSADTMTVELSRSSCSSWVCRIGEDFVS